MLGDVLGHWTPDEWAQQAEESLKENPPAGYNKVGMFSKMVYPYLPIAGKYTSYAERT